MIARKRIKDAIEAELNAKDPADENKKRNVINWPMAKFRFNCKTICDLQPVQEVYCIFSDEDIKKQLTTLIFKTSDRTIRMVYDYRTDKVECVAVGKDLDPVRRTIDVTECLNFAKEFFPCKKRIVVVRKKI